MKVDGLPSKPQWLGSPNSNCRLMLQLHPVVCIDEQTEVEARPDSDGARWALPQRSR